jgi:lysyl-tRNA synthetase class I
VNVPTIYELAAYFLLCDANDPSVDYNNPYCNQNNTNYLDEATQFIRGAEYLYKNLKDLTEEGDINAVVFDSARATSLAVPVYFKRCYQVLFRQDGGPKLATFIHLLGTKDFKEMFTSRLKSGLLFR